MENKFTPEQINVKLRSIFEDTFEKQAIPEYIRPVLLENGLRHFSYGRMGVEALTSYPKISDFVRINSEDIFNLPEDSNAQPSKEILFLKLVKIANSGDLSQYRKVRAEYSSAS